VWDEFAGNPEKLASVAAAIRSRIGRPDAFENIRTPFDEEDEFPEGKVLFRAHRSRERNRTLIEAAKSLALHRDGALRCQACDFDFKAAYGKIGDGFIECHHVVPISELSPESTTRVRDLALLCANCHRMVHRHRPWLSVADLKFWIRH
jgi:5-methylcytosine-specific restriction protein A